MVSGLCLWRSRVSLTTPGPPKAHPSNIRVFFKTISDTFILSQQLKNPYFSRIIYKTVYSIIQSNKNFGIYVVLRGIIRNKFLGLLI